MGAVETRLDSLDCRAVNAVERCVNGLRSGSAPPMRRDRGRLPRTLALTGILLLASGLLAACGDARSTTGTVRTGKGVERGGIATYALPVGDDFSWILPLENEANYENYDSNVESGLWRPLYFAGGPGKTGIDEQLSIAEPPVYSAGDSRVTITLKPTYRWSDGEPVTVRDVAFFFELEAAGAKNGDYAPYLPGRMPDDIAHISYEGPYRFTLQLIHPYNPVWFTGNQLTWIYPLPRQAWDKSCDSCAVGSRAHTGAGARAVYDYLYAQSSDLSGYATNPLWKVVDGPWTLRAYDPTTYHAVFARNPAYRGPDRPKLAGYAIDSFASATAELDAVRSGIVDFGYLPLSDTGLASELTAHGFVVAPWRVFYDDMAEFGYTGPDRALVAQLSIRQALQHLVDEPLYLSATLHGNGLADYGAAPDYPGSSYVSPALRRDPYPYSLRAARALLSSHGWRRGSTGIDYCARPGTGRDECGPGIEQGRRLILRFMYSMGIESLASQVEAFATAAAQVGIGIVLAPESQTTMYSIAGVCPPGPCDYGLALYDAEEDFGQYVLVPTAGVEFAKGNYWGGGYDSPVEQHLLADAYRHPGLHFLYAVEDYQQRDVAGLWWPVADYEVVVVGDDLRGWYPLNPYANYRPSTWYFSSGSN